MRRDTAERDQSHQELALRATLQAHASEAIDIDAAWHAVAPRLAPHTGVALHHGRRRPLARISRGALVAVAVVALIVALAGAGVGAAYWGGLFGGPKAQLIGNERLYTTIGQRQTVAGVTVSVDQAYADPDDTYIAFSFTMPYDRASYYSNVAANHMEITDAAGNQAHGMRATSGYICEPLSHDAIYHRDSVEHCLINLGPFQPAAGASSLYLHFEIGEVWLFRTADHEREILAGPWLLQFNLPFHQQSRGLAGSYSPSSPTP